MRECSDIEASDKVVELLNRGVAPQSIFDALFNRAGEMLMRAPGILSLHATTCTNAIHYAWQHSQEDQTRRLLLLQIAAYLPLYRGNNKNEGVRISDAQVDDAMKNLSVAGTPQADDLRPAVEGFLMVQSNFERAASGIKVTKPLLKYQLASADSGAVDHDGHDGRCLIERPHGSKFDVDPGIRCPL